MALGLDNRRFAHQSPGWAWANIVHAGCFGVGCPAQPPARHVSGVPLPDGKVPPSASPRRRAPSAGGIEGTGMAGKGALWRTAAAAVLVGAVAVASWRYGLDKDSALGALRGLSERLGPWAVPAYVAVHTVTLALCLPHAVFFEAGAPVLFGFLPALGCVFSAKILGASLSFWIGRAIFRSSRSAMEWIHRNKYFHLLVQGVERDGWKFVLLARFSPLPSYVINYTLAATEVSFLVDFLLPTVIGCLPMILQNTSIGSLAGAVASTTGPKKSHVFSYLFPIIGIVSSILISLRIRRYSSQLSVAAERESSSAAKNHGNCNDANDIDGASEKPRDALRRRH